MPHGVAALAYRSECRGQGKCGDIMFKRLQVNIKSGNQYDETRACRAEHVERRSNLRADSRLR